MNSSQVIFQITWEIVKVVEIVCNMACSCWLWTWWSSWTTLSSSFYKKQSNSSKQLDRKLRQHFLIWLTRTQRNLNFLWVINEFREIWIWIWTQRKLVKINPEKFEFSLDWTQRNSLGSPEFLWREFLWIEISLDQCWGTLDIMKILNILYVIKS